MLGAPPEDPSQAAELEPLEPGDYFTRSQEYTDDEDDAAAKASEQAGNSGEAHPPAPGDVRQDNKAALRERIMSIMMHDD
eukprot:jgi/Tetstr1/432739/TSEL_022105.t1